MLIELLRQTSIRGRAVRPGDVVEAPDSEVAYLLATGKAREVQEPDQPTPATVPAPEARQPRTRKPRA